MALDRRRVRARVEPPRHLLVHDPVDWAEGPGRPYIAWCAARRAWARENVEAKSELVRLYADDVEPPPEMATPEAMISDFDITCVMIGRPRWRSDWAFYVPEGAA